jgi:hypothetical protein
MQKKHYSKMRISPFEFIDANKIDGNLDILEFSIIKYISRKKEGQSVIDLEKSIDCLGQLIESYNRQLKNGVQYYESDLWLNQGEYSVDNYVKQNQLPLFVLYVLNILFDYKLRGINGCDMLRTAQGIIKKELENLEQGFYSELSDEEIAEMSNISFG